MSESAVVSSSGHGPRVSSVPEAIIRIAGNSQDGIQAIGGFLARLAGRSEQEVMTFMTIPSTISGGPSIFQVRIGSGEVLSAGDEADVLLCFYDHSYDESHLLAEARRHRALRLRSREAERGIARDVSPCRRADFLAHGRGHRRHRARQGEEYLRARPAGADVRSQRAEADEAHRGTLRRQRPDRRGKCAGRASTPATGTRCRACCNRSSFIRRKKPARSKS